MKKDCIVCDVDDVMVNFKEVAYQALKKEFDIKRHHSDWFDHNLEKTVEIDNDLVMECFYRHDCIVNCELNDGVKTFFDKAIEKGYTIIALTARAWHPQGEELTNQYFRDKELPISQTIAIPLHESKGDQIKKLQNEYNIVMFIDDHPRHVSEVYERSDLKVGYVFLQTQPWNKKFHLEGVKRIENLNNLKDIFS